MTMEYHSRPERISVADLLEMPQMISVEIKIDRIDLVHQRETDLEDMVIWAQVLQLPLIEMLPYQRDRATLKKSLSFYEERDSDDELEKSSVSSLNRPRLSKKSAGLLSGQPDMNLSESEVRGKKKSEVSGKLNISSKSLKSKSTIKETDSNYTNKKEKLVEEQTKSMSRKSSKTLSFKSDTKKDDDEVLDEQSEQQPSDNTTIPDDYSSKKLKLLTQLFSGTLTIEPDGLAFKSDCCVLLSSPSVSETLYEMEHNPIALNLLRTTPCKRLIGKAIIKFNYNFQNSVVKASKLNGGIVMHTVEDKFKVFTENEKGDKVDIGVLLGSVKLICYGNYGMTEIKSPTGDLMVGNLRKYRSSYHQSDLVKVDETTKFNAYGFKPVATKHELAPGKDYVCAVREDIKDTMFNFVDCFYQPSVDDQNQTSFI